MDFEFKVAYFLGVVDGERIRGGAARATPHCRYCDYCHGAVG